MSPSLLAVRGSLTTGAQWKPAASGTHDAQLSVTWNGVLAPQRQPGASRLSSQTDPCSLLSMKGRCVNSRAGIRVASPAGGLAPRVWNVLYQQRQWCLKPPSLKFLTLSCFSLHLALLLVFLPFLWHLFLFGSWLKSKTLETESIKAKGFVNREQNRLFLTLVAYSRIQKKLTHRSSRRQSRGSGFILSYSTQDLPVSKAIMKTRVLEEIKLFTFYGCSFLPSLMKHHILMAPHTINSPFTATLNAS